MTFTLAIVYTFVFSAVAVAAQSMRTHALTGAASGRRAELLEPFAPGDSGIMSAPGPQMGISNYRAASLPELRSLNMATPSLESGFGQLGSSRRGARHFERWRSSQFGYYGDSFQNHSGGRFRGWGYVRHMPDPREEMVHPHASYGYYGYSRHAGPGLLLRTAAGDPRGQLLPLLLQPGTVRDGGVGGVTRVTPFGFRRSP